MGDHTAHNYFKKVRGSDPRLATCRGKLQSQRSKLNQEINKQTMMRNGAEKLYRVTTNRKLRETVALELSFINSNLQLLKEQLADLNSSVSIYQNNSTPQLVPMIPLGLKETKEIDFTDTFKDFILEHYSEDSGHYEDAIKEFMDIRQAVRTPTRDPNGVKLLFGYYNLLYFVDRRFFPPHRNMGVFFEWFDSLTGVPSTQKTIAFEKASVLFNIAALYTQIAARQDRRSSSGVEAAVDNFLRAAGMFRYIRDNFSNAPSMDLSPDTLDTLIQLMLAQARECLFEKLTPGVENLGLQACLEVAQEAEEVSAVYCIVHRVMSGSPAKDYVPFSWISLLLVKAEHYRAVAHHYAALGFLRHTGEVDEETAACLEFLHNTDANNSATCMDIKMPRTVEERRQLGQAHLRESLVLHEECLRVHRMCRQLRQIDHLQDRLRAAHDAALQLYDACEQEDDFHDLLQPPPIQAATKYQLTLMPPDFSEHAVLDPFHDLGPLKVFNARRQWTAPRTVLLQKGEGGNFGFSVRGDAPVLVAALEPDSTAKEAGLREGDFIVCIGEVDTKWMGHEEVVRLIRESGDSLSLKVVTPTDHAAILRPSPSATLTVKPRPTTLTSPFAKDKRRRATWNFFRRSRDSDFPVLDKKDDNVLFR